MLFYLMCFWNKLCYAFQNKIPNFIKIKFKPHFSFVTNFFPWFLPVQKASCKQIQKIRRFYETISFRCILCIRFVIKTCLGTNSSDISNSSVTSSTSKHNDYSDGNRWKL